MKRLLVGAGVEVAGGGLVILIGVAGGSSGYIVCNFF